MTAGKEVELKLALTPASATRLKDIAFIRALKKPPRCATEVSVYFDTEKHKLHKKGVMLRVRRSGKKHVQTVKLSGNSGALERDEWETEIASAEPDLSLARDTALKTLITGKLRRQIKPMFETRVRRTVYPLVNKACAIELTVDRGKIDTGDNSAPLCEIELELKRGEVTELFAVARQLARALPVQIALKSKSERGYELIDGQQDAPVKAGAIDLVADTDMREGLQTIGRACLRQIVHNEPALLKGDPDGLHQMRVGLRRLRVAMSLFSELLDDRQTAAIKTEIRWLTGELAPARELEVLINRVIRPMQDKRNASGNGIPSLSREFADRREAALARAKKAVMSARFRTLTLEIAAWLDTGDWTKLQDDLVRSRGDMPVQNTAEEQLARRWRKVRKRGKSLTHLDPARRHKLRIQVKKLRYATEFFGSLFPGKQAAKQRKKFAAALGRLQDGLGDLNDIAVDKDLIAANGTRQRDSKRAFAAGLLAGEENARLDTAMTAAAKGYAAFAKVRPFW